MLDINEIYVAYGEVPVLRKVSVAVAEDEGVAVIGPNGSGKSTLLKAISGILPCQRGKMIFEGIDITSLRPGQRVRLGIAQVPEGRQIFSTLTTLENLELGAHCRYGQTPKLEIDEDMNFIFGLFPILRQRKKQEAGTLSGGEQQMLAIGRALMSKPKILLLDEPSLGLAPVIRSEIFAVLSDLSSKKLSILLVEQDAKLALRMVQRGYVLRGGHVIAHDTSNNLIADGVLERLYLGEI
jgi:branched-chain amino acid transport system ATP-binding protein